MATSGTGPSLTPSDDQYRAIFTQTPANKLSEVMTSQKLDKTKMLDIAHQLFDTTLKNGTFSQIKELNNQLEEMTAKMMVLHENPTAQKVDRFSPVKNTSVSEVEGVKVKKTDEGRVVSQMTKIDSMQQLIDIIDKSGVSPEKIFVGLDFDGNVNLPKLVDKRDRDGNVVLNPKTNQPYKEKRAALREGVGDFFSYLASRNIKTGIITAADKGGVESIPTTLKQAGVDFDKSIFATSFFKENDINPETGKVIDFNRKDPKTGEVIGYNAEVLPYKDRDSGVKVSINQCHGIVSCSSAYDKQIAIKFLMDKMDPKPELFIYSDDGAVNVVNIHGQFKDSIPTVAAFFPHEKSSHEPGHEESLPLIMAEMEKNKKS